MNKKLENFLTDEEVTTKQTVVKRFLKDINTVTDRNMDTSNDGKKQFYSDMVLNFQVDNPFYIGVLKSNYCEDGHFVHQTFLNNVLQQANEKARTMERSYLEQVKNLKDKIKELEEMKKKNMFATIFDNAMTAIGLK